MKVCSNELGAYGQSDQFLEFPAHMLYKNGGYYSTKDGCSVDICLVDEIKYLWLHGVHTMGCCCGHGKTDGYIQVLNEKDIGVMLDESYIQLSERDDCFKPKSKHKTK